MLFLEVLQFHGLKASTRKKSIVQLKLTQALWAPQLSSILLNIQDCLLLFCWCYSFVADQACCARFTLTCFADAKVYGGVWVMAQGFHRLVLLIVYKGTITSPQLSGTPVFNVLFKLFKRQSLHIVTWKTCHKIKYFHIAASPRDPINITRSILGLTQNVLFKVQCVCGFTMGCTIFQVLASLATAAAPRWLVSNKQR